MDLINIIVGAVGVVLIVGLKFSFMFFMRDDPKLRLIFNLAAGAGMLILSTIVSAFCLSLSTICLIGAIVFGGFPVVLMYQYISYIPILSSLSEAVNPLSTVLSVLLLITIIEFVVNIISFFSIFIVPLKIALTILSFVLPLIQLGILSGIYLTQVSGISTCAISMLNSVLGFMGMKLGA